MTKRLVSLFFAMGLVSLNAQIVINNNSPFNSATYLINNVLISGGITPTNHSFIGDSMQIGFFNGENSNLGIDSGIVLSSGNVYDLVGPNASGSTTTGFTLPGDPTLDLVVGPIDYTNDAAVLEFDFVPTSDVISFKYVFGSEEYLEFVSSFNDAFGFFLSGPNPAGGTYVDANLAIVPGTTNTPVSIFNVNDVSNSTYYVDNGDGFTAPQNTDSTVIQFDGFTTPLTATAAVNCGDTYHIKIVVADVNDYAWDSGVFLEAGSFYSPPLDIVDELGIDSTLMNIPCNASIMLTANGGLGAIYQWFDLLGNVISTDPSVIVGPGLYFVSADILGCATLSDTLRVVANDSPSFNFGTDYIIPCNTTTILDPVVTGGLGNIFYTYAWSNNSTDSSIIVSQGTYYLEVDDGTGCYFRDTIKITEDVIPTASISGGGSVCDDGTAVDVSFAFNGLLPWELTYTNGVTSSLVNNILTNNYSFSTSDAGQYGIVLANDVNECIADTIGGTVEVIVNPLPVAEITPNDITIYVGDEIELNTGEYTYYEWYSENDSLLSVEQVLTVTEAGRFYIWVEDEYGCTDISDTAIVSTTPLTVLFMPTIFTPNDDNHNEFFVIKGENIRSFNIQIFTRWGQLVFESNSIDKYWDGFFENKRVPEGTYYYQIDVLGEDRKSFTKTGMIQVIY